MQHFRKYELAPRNGQRLVRRLKNGTDPEGLHLLEPRPRCGSCGTWAVFVKNGERMKKGTKYASSRTQRFPLTSFGLVSHWRISTNTSFGRMPVGVSSMGYTLDTEYAKAFARRIQCGLLSTTTTANKSFLNKH
jgi:hypothetical protein